MPDCLFVQIINEFGGQGDPGLSPHPHQEHLPERSPSQHPQIVETIGSKAYGVQDLPRESIGSTIGTAILLILAIVFEPVLKEHFFEVLLRAVFDGSGAFTVPAHPASALQQKTR